MAKQGPRYEFGGPPGAAGIVFGLPILMYVFYFGCNDLSGCPAPALLEPRTLTWEKLRAQIPWPQNGIWGFASWNVTAWVLGYYLLSLILYRVLPAHEVYGSKLAESGRPLKYRFNAFNSTIVQLAGCAIGTYLHGADFVVWTFITDNYLQILTANIILSYIIATWVYIRSFSVKPGNPELRELARGGHTGNFIYDYYIGRELNPRVTLPFIGEVDVKAWLEMRPGLTGWALLDLAFIAKQYRTYGYISNSIVFITAVQSYYVLEGQYAEAGILGMMDLTTDGLGFMLSFGDIVWVPFLYSTQCRYLSVYPVQLGWTELIAVAGVFAIGVYIFRASNSQKNAFRTNPDDPQFANASYLQTKRGTRLLTSGWWGVSRHINYLGDWLQSSPFTLPTGIAGYLIVPAGSSLAAGAVGSTTTLDGRVVIQDAARGWGMLFTYFYAAWFAFMLVHREGRDDAACQQKYGDDWNKYKKIVKWRIIPGIY
ncbi:delta-sterol reductase [Colletotrichum truncatum]|uniref:Delta-sterol reductase n=1 Tax=Colletotrichum truncatum TaxID=5467 RepID=A0ACC3Z2D6_COLTU|nr:delta-sterol reductase [Colletotrichum truncatum]KAF6780843.1 delta-sterol reductase [Colletotrichum truncatum]